MKYNIGQRLVGDRTAKIRFSSANITESQFADDAAIYSVNRSVFEESSKKFVRTPSEWGLSVSTEKTKGLAVDIIRDEDKTTPIQLYSRSIEMAEKFCFSRKSSNYEWTDKKRS